jgi:hypothetical protein
VEMKRLWPWMYHFSLVVSPVLDPLAFAVDTMSLSWDGMFAYSFPPFRFFLQVLFKIKQSDFKVILIAPLGLIHDPCRLSDRL